MENSSGGVSSVSSMSPRRAAVLSVGDELILGQTLDTNSRLISQRLVERGVQIVEHATVDDDLGRLSGAIARLGRSCDLLIVTGGLGPTDDDLTRQALAASMQEPLVADPAALEQIRRWFEGRGRAMPELNRRQAMRPTSARMLDNPNGTAPGLAADLMPGAGGCRVFCLPGPPREMVPMLERFVLASLGAAPGTALRVRLVRTFGLGESLVAERLGELMARNRNPMIGTTVSKNVVTVRLRWQGAGTVEEADAALDRDEAELRRLLHPACFDDPVALAAGWAPEEDPIAYSVVGELARRGRTLATAESCTGGLIGSLVTSVAGSSRVYAGGLVTYANEAKTELLGVPVDLLRRHGAVSGEVARQMAAGGLARLRANHCLAVTGVAGPGGGTEEKPVGTVWIALASADEPERAARSLGPAGGVPGVPGSSSWPDGVEVEARRFRFAGGRDSVREWAARTALGMLRLKLAGERMALLGEQPA